MNQRSKIGPTADEKKVWKCNSSEYNNRYHIFTIDQQTNAKPPAVKQADNRETFINDLESFNTSSYMNDYAQKPSTAPVRVKRNMGPSSIAAHPSAKMDCNSSYRSSFEKKNAKPAKAIRPPPPQGLGWSQPQKDPQAMDLASVSMNCYRPYTAGEVTLSKRDPIIISPEYGAIDTNPATRPEMNFHTTVQKNFVKHTGNFRPPPASGAIKTPAHGIAGIAGADINAKMDLTTTHREVFQPKENEAVENAVPPLAKDKSAKTPKWYKSIESNSNSCSTQRYDYIHHSGVTRPRSFKDTFVKVIFTR